MEGLIMDYPLTLDKILARARRVFPEKEVVSVLPTGKVHRYGYADLHTRSIRLMNVLRTLGVGKGDRIGTFLWNHHQHLELYFAIPSLGAVTHTLNIRLSEEQLAYIINHAGDSVIFVDASLLGALEAVAPQLESVRQYVIVGAEGGLPDTPLSPVDDFEELVAAADDRVDIPPLNERDACGLCYTSGTTGNPKGVLYSHRGIFIHTLMAGMTDMLGPGERDVILPVVPMFHANAWCIPFIAPMTGSKLVFAGPNVAPEILVPLMREEGVTLSMGVPTIWNAVWQYLRTEGGGLGEVKTLVVGGSAAPRAMIESFKKDYGVDIVHGWGMTEMSPLGSLNRPRRIMEDWSEDKRFSALSRVGIPAPCVEMKVVDDAGEELPWDGKAAGELLVRGPAIASGYFRGEGGVDQFTGDGWFRTGDVVSIDEYANVGITDRTKDLIKSGGEWISSVEMENAIMAVPGVLEAAVVARPDPKWDERPVAFVVRKPEGGEGAETLEASTIIAHLAGEFAKWQLPGPEDIRFLAELPKTSVGKFDKKVLRAGIR